VIGAAILVLLAVGALLVPELRAQPVTWLISGALLLLAVVIVVLGFRPGGRLTARQVKYGSWWGYTSHDGSGEVDIREKRGD
jgi:hypothetical protein